MVELTGGHKNFQKKILQGKDLRSLPVGSGDLTTTLQLNICVSALVALYSTAQPHTDSLIMIFRMKTKWPVMRKSLQGMDSVRSYLKLGKLPFERLTGLYLIIIGQWRLR